LTPAVTGGKEDELDPRERVHFWRIEEGGGAEFLHARFHRHSYARHTHDRYVLAAVLHGWERFHYRGADHVIASGQFAVVHPDELHDGEAAVPETGFVYRTSYLSPDLFARAAAEVMTWREGELPAFPQVTIPDPDLAARFVALHRTAEAATPLERESRLLLLLEDLVRRHAAGPRRAPAASDEPLRVRRVRARLEEDLTRAPGLEDLAAEAGLSPLHLLRVFRRHPGVPPHVWLQQRRIAEAVRLLRRGEATAEVAVACGFVDQSHLTRTFRRMVGLPPAAFRSGSYKRPTGETI